MPSDPKRAAAPTSPVEGEERSSAPDEPVGLPVEPHDSQVKTLVLGDISVDTLIAPLPREHLGTGHVRLTGQRDESFLQFRHPGGAWLIREIIQAALNNQVNGAQTTDCEGRVVKIVADATTYDRTQANLTEDKLASHLDPRYMTSYALLGLYPQKSKGAPEDRVYRIKQLLGWLRSQTTTGRGEQVEALIGCLSRLAQPVQQPRILVLHDAAGDFRRLGNEELSKYVVPHLQTNPHFAPDSTTPGWLVWQMYSPLGVGNLWSFFSSPEFKHVLARTVIIVKSDCLRQAGVNLADGMSLERESVNFLTGIEQVESLRQLSRAGHLVVHFHRQGALHYSRDEGLQYSCYFCPGVKEDPARHNLGTMVGYTSLMVAAIVRGLTWSLSRGEDGVPGLVAGIKQGVVLDHLHFINGYAKAGFHQISQVEPRPYEKLFTDIYHAWDNNLWYQKGKTGDDWRQYRMAVLKLPGGQEILRKWSRIEGFVEQRREALRRNDNNGPKVIDEQSETLACEIVLRGLRKVVDPDSDDDGNKDPSVPPGTPPASIRCPYQEHGKIKTADRHEIDSFASIFTMISKYRSSQHWKHPLCIAVFGPPGSGKSFTIQQILTDVDPEIAKRPLEFNLAQFKGVEDLHTAFHQVQDRSLANEVPLVVFDEFDTNLGSERLGWLKFFLAPMQDGKFKAGESMYRIGRAIFVFAGGVARTFTEFYDNQKGKDYFNAAKGPDFVSRLRGHLNILGINPGRDGGAQRLEAEDSQATVSPVLMVRRAVLLRALLEDRLKEVFDPNTEEARIDRDVIRAFLHVKRYEHGARSMQAIIEMTQASHRGFFLKSSLPSSAQLNMHVDANEFLSIVHRHNYGDYGDM